MLNFQEFEIVDDFVCVLEEVSEEDLNLIECFDLEDMQAILDEKLSVKDAIQAKKKKRKRDRTAAGKMAKRKLKIKTSRSSYRPNKKLSRASKKSHKRVRRNLPPVSG